MELSGAILVGTFPISCMCFIGDVSLPFVGHHQSGLPGVCARKQKAILATDTTWLLKVLYSIHSALEHSFRSAISVSYQMSITPFRYIWWYVRALPKHPLFSASSMTRRHPLFSSSISILFLCEGIHRWIEGGVNTYMDDLRSWSSHTNQGQSKNCASFHPCQSTLGTLCGQYRYDPLAWLLVQWFIIITYTPTDELRGTSKPVWMTEVHGTSHANEATGCKKHHVLIKVSSCGSLDSLSSYINQF